MPADLVSVLNILVSAFTSIVVAFLGYHQTKKSKDTEAYRKLREANEKLTIEKEEKWRAESSSRMDKMEKDISKLSDDVTRLNAEVNLDAVEKQLTQLHTLNEMNFEYVQSLSNVVITIGESLSSSDTIDTSEKKQMTKEIKDHKMKADDITKRLYKIIV